MVFIMEIFKIFLIESKKLFKKFKLMQRVTIFIVTVLSVIIISFILKTNQKDYVVLYRSLVPEDAQKIREKLDEQGVYYRLDANGTAILVPKGQETELRFKIISELFQPSEPILSKSDINRIKTENIIRVISSLIGDFIYN